MSVHSLNVLDGGYKGYKIDENGGVTEIYDHRDNESTLAPPSTSVPLVPSYPSHPPRSNPPRTVASQPQRSQGRRNVRYRRAGCCDSCVSVLVACGNLPFATAFSLFCIWAGTAMFVGGGANALVGTIDLFQRYGPLEGNPGTDPPPEYIYFPTGDSAVASQHYQLRDTNNLGNRVPKVFDSIQYAMYAIAPFMVLMSLLLVCDNHYSNRAIRKRNRKSVKHASSGICCTSGLIFIGYILVLFWIITTCFTTLGVYYYRMVMLRCYDLEDRGYGEGVLPSICIDLVQMGLIMFKDTTQEGFAKICGPGENMRTYGNLKPYCENYYPTWQAFLVTFAGCMLNVIGLINFLMMMSSNYNQLAKPRYGVAESTAAPTIASRPTPAPSTVRTDLISNPPSYAVGDHRRRSRDLDADIRRSRRDLDADIRRSRRDLDEEFPRNAERYRSSRDLLDARRRSRFDDIEMDSLDDRRSLDGRRGFDGDSNMGVNYYYRRH